MKRVVTPPKTIYVLKGDNGDYVASITGAVKFGPLLCAKHWKVKREAEIVAQTINRILKTNLHVGVILER